MSDTVKPGVTFIQGNTQVRVEGEIGPPANQPPNQPGRTQLNGIGGSVSTNNPDNTSTSIGAQVTLDQTGRPDGFRINFGNGPRQDGQPQPYTTTSTNPVTGQPMEMPGFRMVYPQANNDPIVGAGVRIESPLRPLQTPTPQDPNAQLILGQTSIGVGGAVNLNNGQTAGNVTLGGSVVAPILNDPYRARTEVQGITVGPQVQFGSNAPTTIAPYGNVFGTTPSPEIAPANTLRFSNPQPQDQPAAFNPQAALDNLRRGPEYNQALTGLRENGYPQTVTPDSPTDRLAVGIALAAQKNGAQVTSIDIGNTVFNAQGNPDRNVFYGGQENSQLRVSEQQSITTPVTDQITRANQERTQAPQQIAAPERINEQPTQEPQRLR
jgi:hypothetical protein